ncbi:peptide MFS transporter [Erwinia piriflorinigrans]|uniref:Proton-dependent oligopeptide transporter, POT family n=1 Tax=Erwinia piriflorinigrans CFBP 5888 TaxID=1161919 RepID=V5Z965_9GAMM|nr:oligopeptide:H+ symporter [Erwinia piriflorinigrans]CCG87561.1 proton-dependent oligopeptide transporter, POT family [Erwinia piriflorinigrans CFBP 5888]
MEHTNQIPLQRATAGTGALFFIQTFATMGFAVLYSSLVLYATKRLGFSEGQANTMMGVFGAFNYGLHLFGGYLGGRFLSNRSLFTLGMVLQIAGCWTLSGQSAEGLYWGLAMFLTGSGLNVTCINMMLTQRFSPQDNRRESAFLWNYAGMNLGFFLGFTGAGYFQLSEHYEALFLFATTGNTVAIIISLLCWKTLADINTPLLQASRSQFRWRLLGGLAILLLLVPTIRLMLHHAGFTGSFVLVLGAAVFLMLCLTTLRHRPHDEQRRMSAYLLLSLGALVFWTLYQLAPMGLMLFTEHNINLNVYGIQVAPQWVQNTNTLVIVFGGPLLALSFRRLRERGWRIDIPRQFACSLFFIGLGMLVLPCGIALAGGDGLVAFKWIVTSYVLQSIGELLISPIGYAMIGKLAPVRYQGVMMGCWMMTTGVASVLAGYVSALMPENSGSTPLLTNPGYSHIFSLLGWGSVVVGLLLVFLSPLLRRLIQTGDQR